MDYLNYKNLKIKDISISSVKMSEKDNPSYYLEKMLNDVSHDDRKNYGFGIQDLYLEMRELQNEIDRVNKRMDEFRKKVKLFNKIEMDKGIDVKNMKGDPYGDNP